MRKYPPDVNVSETCIDANLKMVERRDPDNFPRFPLQEWCAWTIPEIALKNYNGGIMEKNIYRFGSISDQACYP